jgi:2'-5' RNA ligase
MTKTVTSACVIIPPKDIWEPIQKIRRKYDSKVQRWMPHINLFYPFTPKQDYDKIFRDFEIKCNQINAFTIYLKQFKYFRHRYQTYTIRQDPEPNDLIIHLQRKLLKVAPEYNDVNQFSGGFRPHLSVGQFTTYKIHDFIAQLQKNWDPLKFRVNQIYFISRANTKDSAFRIIKKIKLNQ